MAKIGESDGHHSTKRNQHWNQTMHGGANSKNTMRIGSMGQACVFEQPRRECPLITDTKNYLVYVDPFGMRSRSM